MLCYARYCACDSNKPTVDYIQIRRCIDFKSHCTTMATSTVFDLIHSLFTLLLGASHVTLQSLGVANIILQNILSA